MAQCAGHRADGTMHGTFAEAAARGLEPGAERALAREREILERLTHPNIARLYDAGLTSKGGHSWRWNYGHGWIRTFRKQIAGCREIPEGTKKA